MKPEEEIVTARITRKEAEGIAAKRWLKPRLNKMLYVMLASMGVAVVIILVDSVGVPKDAHRLGGVGVPLAGLLFLAGFTWPYYVAMFKADRIGKDEAKKLIV